ncbi:acyl--CoA ligase [Rhodobacteraceae bacterium LMO-12]|nr:acyl--CoA ligase [Rhodobacteraceae bacterium LMO-JJ12]
MTSNAPSPATGTIPRLDRITDYVTYWASETPDAPAYRFDGETQSYVELSASVDRWARAMLACGIGPGDRVAMLSTPRPEFFISFLAATSIGAVWVGLNPKYTEAEIARPLADATPSLVISLHSFEGVNLTETLSDAVRVAKVSPSLVVFGGQASGFEDVEAFLSKGDGVSTVTLQAARDAVGRDDAALIVYTSGSTGVPKGAMLAHRGLCHGYPVQSAHFGLIGASILCNLPINHIGCVGDLSCGPLVAGGTLVFMERFDPQAILDAVVAGEIDCLLGVPTILQIISELPGFEEADFSQMRLVCWGGAALATNVLARYRAKGCPLGLTYGMSELPGSITMSALNADDRELTQTVGRPVEPLDIRLIKDDGSICAIDEEGEVCLRHESLLLGYYNREDATREAYDDEGYFRTGDVGVMEPQGTIRLVGRKKEMFKSGGYNVYPREIEMVLESHPSIATAAVVAVSDAKWQEVGWAFVLAPGCSDPDVLQAELNQLCQAQLANYKRPKRIVVRAELPMLPIGKVDKVRLKQEAGAAAF